MRIRPAEVSDAPRLAEIHVRSWQTAYAGQLPSSFLKSLDPLRRSSGWEATLRKPDVPGQATLLAEDDSRLPVGFVHVCPAREDLGDTVGEVAALYVAPECWRAGVGRRLMKAAVNQLADAGFRRGILWVLRSNERAIRFYEATGWGADGATKQDTIGGLSVTELRMSRRLP